MKKLLGISLVAVLTATPLMAGATDLTSDQMAKANIVTGTDDKQVAAVSYVKGAYKELGDAINTKQDKITEQNKLSANLVEGVAAASDVTALTTRVTTAEEDIDALEAADTALAGRVTTAEGKITAAESAITTLNGDATTVNSVDYKIAQSNTTLNTAIDAKADQTALDTEVAERQSADTALQTAIDAKAAAADLTALGNRVTTAEGKITAAESAITTLNGDATTVNSVNYKIAQSNMALNTAINAAATTAETNAKAYADSLVVDAATKTGVENTIKNTGITVSGGALTQGLTGNVGSTTETMNIATNWNDATALTPKTVVTGVDNGTLATNVTISTISAEINDASVVYPANNSNN